MPFFCVCLRVCSFLGVEFCLSWPTRPGREERWRRLPTHPHHRDSRSWSRYMSVEEPDYFSGDISDRKKTTREVLLSKHFKPWDARSLSVHYSPPILLAFADVWKKCRDDFHAELNSILNSTLLCNIPKIFLIPRFWSLKIFLISCLKFWVACNYWSGVGAG